MRSALCVFSLGMLVACHRPREEPPDHLARLRGMYSSAPAFWDREDKGLVPWPSDVDALYREGSVEGAPHALGCEIVLHGYSENVFIKAGPESAKADLSVRAWLGTDRGRYFFRVEGRDNQNDGRIVFPIVDLRRGDPVVFDILDRDAIGYSSIDRVEGVLAGPPPFRFTGKRTVADVSCRPLVAAPFERAFAALEPKVKERIAVVEARKPNVALADLGLPRTYEHDARDAVIELAAYAGWDDPRIKAMLVSLRAAEVASDAALRTFVLDERARVGSETTLEDGLVVRARRVQDKPPEIELDVKNGSKGVIVLGAPFHGLEGFTVSGARTQLFPDESAYDVRVRPGASVTLHYRAAVGAGYEAPKAAMLLRSHRRELELPIDRSFVSPITNARLSVHLDCDAKKVCTVRVTTDGGAPLADATRGLRIEPKVRGSRDGTPWRPYEWTLREKDVAPDDVTILFELSDARGEIPWSVATDR